MKKGRGLPELVLISRNHRETTRKYSLAQASGLNLKRSFWNRGTFLISPDISSLILTNSIPGWILSIQLLRLLRFVPSLAEIVLVSEYQIAITLPAFAQESPSEISNLFELDEEIAIWVIGKEIFKAVPILELEEHARVPLR